MTTMTLYVKHGDIYVKHYWVRRDNNVIVGWFAGTAYRCALGLPDNATVDIHFTYPASSEMHYSLKCREMRTNVEHYHSVFRKKIQRKTIRPGHATVKHESARGQSEDLFTHMMCLTRPPSFEDYRLRPEFFQFTNCFIPLNNGSVMHGPRELAEATSNRPRPSDLIVDPATLCGTGMNICALLHGAGSAVYVHDGLHTFVKTDDTDTPRIDLLATINP